MSHTFIILLLVDVLTSSTLVFFTNFFLHFRNCNIIEFNNYFLMTDSSWVIQRKQCAICNCGPNKLQKSENKL